MKNHNERYEKLIEKFILWGRKHEDIRTAIVVGSRARTKNPADEWSDLDLVIFTRNTNKYISTIKWIEKIGDYWITFVEDTAVGGSKERRVLFEDGLDVDFSFFPVQFFKDLNESSEIQTILNRGIRVLFDKDDLFNDISKSLKDFSDLHSSFLPSKEEFNNLINDFWYHAVWSSKKLLRGELWVAKSCVDDYMKSQLLRVAEWYSKVNKGRDCDTWHTGRYFDKWADDRIKEDIKNCFAHYNRCDIERALYKTINLFRWVTVDISEKLGYKYPLIADEKAMEWIENNLVSEKE